MSLKMIVGKMKWKTFAPNIKNGYQKTNKSNIEKWSQIMPQWIFPPTKIEFINLLDNTEKTDWSLIYSKAPAVWKETEGEGVKVAIIDADIIKHPDI